MRAWWARHLLRRDRDRAYWAWRRAIYLSRDTVTIWIEQPGAWRRGGPIDAAQRAERDAYEEFTRLRGEVERAEEMR